MSKSHYSSQCFHSNKNNTHLVCILVWHSILFIMGYRMVSSTALFSYYKLTKKVIGGPSFCTFMVSFILGSIFRGNSPMIMVPLILKASLISLGITVTLFA